MKRLHPIIQKHSHVNIHFIRSTPWNSSIPLHVRLLSSSTFTMEPPDKFTITIYIIIKDRTPRGRTQKVSLITFPLPGKKETFSFYNLESFVLIIHDDFIFRRTEQ